MKENINRNCGAWRSKANVKIKWRINKSSFCFLNFRNSYSSASSARNTYMVVGALLVTCIIGFIFVGYQEIVWNFEDVITWPFSSFFRIKGTEIEIDLKWLCYIFLLRLILAERSLRNFPWNHLGCFSFGSWALGLRQVLAANMFSVCRSLRSFKIYKNLRFLWVSSRFSLQPKIVFICWLMSHSS